MVVFNTHTNTVKRKSDCCALLGVLLKHRTPLPICAMCTRWHKSQWITTANHHKPHIIKILQTTEWKNGVPINLENQRKKKQQHFWKKQIKTLNYDKKIHNYIRLRDLFLLPNFAQMKKFSLGNLFKMQSIATKQTFSK